MNIFEFIKTRVSIMDVITEYVSLKKAGLYWKGRCPFHHERTGSFTVSPHREIFYCFGCHKGGDVIAFIAEAEHCSALAAAQHLAEQFSIELPAAVNSPLPKSEASGEDLRRHSQLCTRAALWMHQELLTYAHAKNYLDSRGINERSQSDFMLGYFPENRLSALLDFMKKDGFLAQELIHAHILMEGKFGLYSPFAERIVFPIKDHLGRVVGFGGRVFKADDQRPKYYNSQDHVYFSKGHLLFGLDKAKKPIQEAQSLFLVEGYLDCIAMSQAGYKNTVATLGTACTLDHLKVISRYAQRLYIMYDGDAAGQAAMIKLTQISWSLNMELFVTQLPQTEDPASYLQKHGTLGTIIEHSVDIFHFFIGHLGMGYQNKPLQERLNLVSEFTSIIALLDDPLKQNLLLQKAAATFDIPFSILSQNTQSSKRVKSPAESSKSLPLDQPEPTQVELSIITALINSDSSISSDDQEILKKNCTPQICQIVEKLLLYNSEKGKFNFTSFMERLQPGEKESFAQLVLLGEESQKIALADLLHTLWKKEWKIIASDVKMRLRRAEAAHDQNTITAITAEFGGLKKKMRDKGIL